jgi:hypothetical protein
MKHSSTIALSILSLSSALILATACRSEHASSGARESGARAEETEADEELFEKDAKAGREEQDEESAKEETITLAQTPEAVRASLAKLPPMGDVKKVERITRDESTSFEIGYERNGAKSSVTLSEQGDVMEIEKPAGDLPLAVTRAITEEMHGAKVLHAESVQLSFYEVVVERDGKKHEVKISADGHIMGGEERD